MNTQSVQKFVLATRKKAGHASYISYGPYGKRPTSRTYRRLKNAFMKRCVQYANLLFCSVVEWHTLTIVSRMGYVEDRLLR